MAHSNVVLFLVLLYSQFQASHVIALLILSQSQAYSAPEKEQTTPTTKVLTDEEAIAIANKELKGEVDALSYRSTSDGGYYLIEIDGDEAEAVFQIHALSGEILSITWDE